MTLNETQKPSYADRGFLVVERLLDEDLVADACCEISAIVARHPDVPPELAQMEPQVLDGGFHPSSKELGVRKLFRMAVHNELFRALASHPGMTGIARSLLGQEIRLAQSMLLMKPPHVGGVKVWHQDNAYFRLAPNRVLGFWVALDEATVDNGCMHVVPGSHREGIARHAGAGDEYGLIDQPRFEAALSIPLQPGDALVFHGELHHGTPANRTETRRRALQYHYSSAEAAEACGGVSGRQAELDP